VHTARWQEQSDVQCARDVVIDEVNDFIGLIDTEAVKQREAALGHDGVASEQCQTKRR